MLNKTSETNSNNDEHAPGCRARNITRTAPGASLSDGVVVLSC